MSTTKEIQQAMTPSEALGHLVQGNMRFTAGQSIHSNLMPQVKETASGQFPFAAILGCIDSRATAEQVFDQGVGDLFNARVAGNVVNEDVLGSIEYACHVAGAKLIVVLGHTACGAVTAATQRVELGNITALLSKITPVVDSFGKGDLVVDDVAERNVQHSMDRIRSESAILAKMEQEGSIQIVGAMYDVATGKVRFLD